MSKKKNRLIVGIYNAEEILSLLYKYKTLKKKYLLFEGYKIKVNNIKYSVFNNQKNCLRCGRKITTAKLEHFKKYKTKVAFFNFYSKDNVLMTKDHIIPISKNGNNTLKNLQTMCTICNIKKSDKVL